MALLSRIQKYPGLTCMLVIFILFFVFISWRVAWHKPPLERRIQKKVMNNLVETRAADALRRKENQASFRENLTRSTKNRFFGRQPLSYIVHKKNKTISTRFKNEGYNLWPRYSHEGNPKGDRIIKQLTFEKQVSKKNIDSEYKKSILWYGEPTSIEKINVFENCYVSNCELQFDVDESGYSDAIIFHERQPFNDLKFNRPFQQIWILWLNKHPFYTPRLEGFNSVINWTFSHRQDSSIVTTPEIFYKFSKIQPTESVGFPSGKTRIIAWLSDDCDSPNQGYFYIRTMEVYLKVGVYGPCGNMACPPQAESKCLSLIRAKYKFMFVIERSNCRDCISGAFYKALRNDVVPVVLGAPQEDYERIAPPHSYIHVDSFENSGQLAEYLKHLATNDYEYQQYFEWKKFGTMINTKPWCRLCAMLNLQTKKTRYYKNIDRWWRKGATSKGQSWFRTPAYTNYYLTPQQFKEETNYSGFAYDEITTSTETRYRPI